MRLAILLSQVALDRMNIGNQYRNRQLWVVLRRGYFFIKAVFNAENIITLLLLFTMKSLFDGSEPFCTFSIPVFNFRCEV